jgi:hypothetical protein
LTLFFLLVQNDSERVFMLQSSTGLLMLCLCTSFSFAGDPLESWIEIDRPANVGAVQSIEFGNGMFIAGAVGGGIITSPDGATWTKQNSGVTADILRLKYVNGRFFASVENWTDFGLTSQDGTNWTSITAMSDITYGNGLYYGAFLTNLNGLRFVPRSSPDLQTWTNYPPLPGTLNIDFYNGLFVSVSGPFSYLSTNGLDWFPTPPVSQAPSRPITSIQNGILFVSGLLSFNVPSPFPPYVRQELLSTVSYSTDGLNWTPTLKTGAPGGFLSKVAAGGSNYVVAGVGGLFYTSNLTNNWTGVTPTFAPDLAGGGPDVAYGNSRFVAILYGKILRSNPVGGGFAPEFVKQPASFAATIGGMATFTALVQGTPPLTFQWRKGGVNIEGATSNVLTLSNVTFDSAGEYDVVVTNDAGSKTSTTAVLNINFADVHKYSGVTLHGAVSDRFLLEYQNELDPAETWQTATTVTLTAPTLIWIDYDSPSNEKRFYRATYQGR